MYIYYIILWNSKFYADTAARLTEDCCSVSMELSEFQINLLFLLKTFKYYNALSLSTLYEEALCLCIYTCMYIFHLRMSQQNVN